VAILAAAVLIGTAAAGGCGIGPGEAQEGTAELRVTREFGQEEMLDGTREDPTESDTVIRFLDDEADIQTSYGGNFVDSIDGVAGSTVHPSDEDWFFFVNGYYSDIGAGEAHVHPGDRIWWDYRDWDEAYRVPAVVGSWPEPFLDGHDGQVLPVHLECLDAANACDTVAARLDEAGAEFTREDVTEPEPHPDDLRILVGDWAAVRADPAAAQIEQGSSTSGVYAEMARCGNGFRLDVQNADGSVVTGLEPGGLVAAVRNGEDQPTWVVTGTDDDSVDAAAGLLDEDHLRDRYALAVDAQGAALPVPAPDALKSAVQVGCP
jgi:hypothetical protein